MHMICRTRRRPTAREPKRELAAYAAVSTLNARVQDRPNFVWFLSYIWG